jgi:regulator of cell morphogenesis and NO signaling
MIDARSTLIRDVVAGDFRTAAVFQKYGLDFCCGGERPIADAAIAKGVDPDAIVADLEAIAATPAGATPKFNTWPPDLLIDYIVANHHSYVRETMPVILLHVEKVARVHGMNHPETIEIAASFRKVAAELTQHMQKEEMVLFPYIKALHIARSAGAVAPHAPFGTVANPIAMMELEHRNAGDEMATIRELSNGYTPPEDACTTYRVAFQELHAFELDLHQHVHLENNVLFPTALALESALDGTVA